MASALIRSMRLKQWTKNVFVVAALVFDANLFNGAYLLRTLAGALVFCFVSSSVYIFNDIFDKTNDQIHPTKKLRPIASGALPVSIAITFAVILLIASLFAALLFGGWFWIIVAVYFLINLAYSKWLKHIPILDVLIVASGFVLRVAGGVALISVQRFSPWLYVVTTLLALYLGFGKRRAELALLAKSEEAGMHRPVLDGYSIPLLDQFITIVSGTTIVAYSLYTFQAENTVGNYFTMLTIPFVVYGIFRYLYLITVKNSGGAPEDLVISDRPLQITFILYAISVLIVYYILPKLTPFAVN